MSEILTKKIYSKNKDTGVETQVYPETNAASVVDFDTAIAAKGFITSSAADTKIEAAIGAIDSFTTPAEVDTKINTAIGGIDLGAAAETSTVTLNNYDFNANVDSLTDGTYIITNATNTPFDGDVNGTLKVISTTENTKIQTWNGKKYTAYREVGAFNPLTAKIDSLTVNGVKVNTSILPGSFDPKKFDANHIQFTEEQFDTYNPNKKKILWLEPGYSYELSGVLTNCQIRVGYHKDWLKKGSFNSTKYDEFMQNADNAGKAITILILNNFYLYDDSHLEFDTGDDDSPENAIAPFQALIISDISGKVYPAKLAIKLKDNTVNYLHRVLDNNTATYNNKWGVIYTESDCDIFGNGSLGIDDGGSKLLGGHAIKAKGNLSIGFSSTDSEHTSTPHIKARVYHDILHGNASIKVYGAYVQALYCNDVFGTDTSRGDNNIGYIRVYNGVFDVRECFGTFMQADDAIVYPNVKISFNTIGEGLWLQCDSGFYKDASLKGEVSGFGIVDEEHKKFDYYEFSDKPDAILFTNYISGHDTRDQTTNLLATTRIMYNGAEVDQALKGDKCIEAKVMNGIRVYNGITVTPDAEYTYSEGVRNTTFATTGNLTLTYNSEIDTTNLGRVPLENEFHHVFAYIDTSVSPGSDEVSLTDAAGFGECLVADADFDSINFEYTGTVTGGIWHIGVTDQGLSDYRSEVEYLMTVIKGMIVPPKELAITEIESGAYDYTKPTGEKYTTENVTNTRTDALKNTTGAEIKKDSTVAATGQVTLGKIKVNGYYYTTKTGMKPNFSIEVGEVIRIHASVLPENATNAIMKWSVAGISEECVIGREKSTDDTVSYCDIRGLQVGQEKIILSAKSLDKDATKLSIPILITVTEPAGE